ncbi:HEPN domain-containing protein [Marinomonas alcarazii]|uniref:ApeA N-terminal domain 1-containing protein n=1 Tax=Marinomonas alcarazii TaxID=491949 RepID=UPI000DA15170|nr:HEPN domain-containing protein [Marinomonas alcarazii]
MDLLLAENLDLNVRIAEGEYCKLKIKFGSLPKLSHVSKHWYFYDNNEDVIQVEGFTEPLSPKYLLSQALNSGTYTNKLFRYVYSGKADATKLKKVYFTFPELAAYFNTEISRNLEQNGDLSGNVTIEPMEATVLKDTQYMKIGLYQYYQLSDTSTNDGFKFTSSMTLVLEFENSINFSDIEKYLYKATNLFTWVTGFPVKVSKIEVSDGENGGSLYIPTVKDTSEHDLSHPNGFMLAFRLREHFVEICESYFVKNTFEFENIWSRTIPLYNFNGILEYETMLYAAILDKYCSYKVDQLNLNSTLDEDEYNELTSKLSALISGETDLHRTFSKGILNDLSNIRVLREILPNRSVATFNQKVKRYLNYIGRHVTEVFLSSDDLYLIKKVRDRAAHGEVEQFSTDEVSKIYWKLRMLVTYLIYKDLGLSDDDFLEIISFGFNPLSLNCEVDKFKLDTKLKEAITLPVSEQVFSELSSNHGVNLVLIRVENLYEVQKEYTIKLSNYFSIERIKDAKISRLDEYVKTLLENPKLEAKYTGNAYVTHKGKSHNLHSIVLVDTPRKLKSYNLL